MSEKELPGLPLHRLAYSDRTALLMAKLSRFAYEKTTDSLREKLNGSDFELLFHNKERKWFFAKSTRVDMHVPVSQKIKHQIIIISFQPVVTESKFVNLTIAKLSSLWLWPSAWRFWTSQPWYSFVLYTYG